ncbi:MAG: formate/nitrite transporter family protein [Geminicoccaceae bacterium]
MEKMDRSGSAGALERQSEPDERPTGSRLSSDDLSEVQDRLRLRAAMVYAIVCREGDEELNRTFRSLWWSGVAAGLSIGFSVVVEGLLRAHLPDAPWRPLIDNVGYSTGFLIVILARQQLFTENTLTAVLPLIGAPTVHNLFRTLRLWGVVLAANMVGAAIFGAALSSELFFSDEHQRAFREISSHFMAYDASRMFFTGIVAGWLIATLVWLLPSPETFPATLIIIITYVIALGGFAHVIAGSVEAFLLIFDGTVGLGDAFATFFLPALAGNIVGGSALFALLAYAQVREEL